MAVVSRDGPAPARTTPQVAVHLLGRPRVEGARYRFRSRKSWALLAHLVLSERPPTRGQLAALLFAEADDPLRTLRWSLAEIRRGLGPGGSVDGDPVVLALPPPGVADVHVLLRGSGPDAVALPGLGADLLAGVEVRGAPGFDSWLLAERRRIAAASEAVLHEAALGAMSRGDLAAARGLAVRAATLGPLDENHQALLVRVYRLLGDDAAARQQYDAFARTLDRELGAVPGEELRAALRERRPVAPPPGAPAATSGPGEEVGVADEVAVDALVEAGSAAVAAGAVRAGVDSLRSAVRLADAGASQRARSTTRLALAEALVHSLRGHDEEGLARLHEVDAIALAVGDRVALARARAELGYVDFLRARYDRADRWLRESEAASAGSPRTAAKAMTYRGTVESERASYPAATALLRRATRLCRDAGDRRREAYGLAMLGRVHLLRGELDPAQEVLALAAAVAEEEHWLSFLPWPQALVGHVHLARGDVDAAEATLRQAFARACQIGDPCWEGISARGLALVADARGDAAGAVDALLGARTRSNRHADPYVWLDVHILDALCGIGVRDGDPRAPAWVASMRREASRAGMRELTVRAMLHGSDLGDPGDAAAAARLAGDVDSPLLAELVRGRLASLTPDGRSPAGRAATTMTDARAGRGSDGRST